MKLIFDVNLARAMRSGKDSPARTVSLEIKPRLLSTRTRELLSQRMTPDGRVCEIGVVNGARCVFRGRTLTADGSDLSALLRAIETSEAQLQASLPANQAEREKFTMRR